MTVAMTVLAPAAWAEFRYVPPEEPVPSAAEPAAGDGGDRPAPPAPETAESGGWRVRAGDTLRETLARWGTRAGVAVLVLTDRRYRLHEARRFPGTFADAVEALFSALAHLPHPPVGAHSADGRTLTVLHRVRPAGEER